MSKAIWKFPIDVIDEQAVEMPAPAELLHVAVQNIDRCYLWAMVDPEKPKVRVQLRIYGTSQPMPDWPGRYIGTLMLNNNGALVFHVFDCSPRASQ